MAKDANKRQAAKQQAADAAVNRSMVIFTVGCVLEFLLLLANRRYVGGTIRQMVQAHSMVQAGLYIGLALLAAGLVCHFLRKGAGWLRKGLLVAGLLLAGCAGMMLQFYPLGTQLLCVLVPALTLLSVIYFLYPRDFFVQALGLGGALLALVLLNRGVDSGRWTLLCAMAGVGAAVLFGGGAWLLRGKLPACLQTLGQRKADAAVLALGGVLLLVAVAVPVAAFYAIWAAGIGLFVLAVYHTVRVM